MVFFFWFKRLFPPIYFEEKVKYGSTSGPYGVQLMIFQLIVKFCCHPDAVAILKYTYICVKKLHPFTASSFSYKPCLLVFFPHKGNHSLRNKKKVAYFKILTPMSVFKDDCTNQLS